MTLRACLITLVMALSACARSPGPAVDIANAWSPLAPPGASVIAVYADITANRADTLLNVSTPLATSTQLHVTEQQDGVMKMRHVERLPLQAGATVHLEPGGMHLMLMGIGQPLAADAQIPLTFHFEKAGDLSVTAQVRNTR